MNAIALSPGRIVEKGRGKNLRFAIVLWVFFAFATVATYAASAAMPIFFLLGAAISVVPLALVAFSGSPAKGLLLSALFLIGFNAFYHPLFGIFSASAGGPTGLYRLVLGMRSAWYAAALLIVTVQCIWMLVAFRIKMLVPFALVMAYLLIHFVISSGAMDSRVSYLLNSFVPFVCTMVTLVAIMQGTKLSEVDAQMVMRTLIIITVIGSTHFILMPLTYDIVRPDLASFLRARPGFQIPKGGYDPGWGSLLFGYVFNRYVGSFPDAIIAGYFCSAMVYVAYIKRYKMPFVFFGILLAGTFSKGAWLFFVQAVIIGKIYARTRFGAFLMAVIFITVQLSLASIVDGSNRMHLYGLIGGFTTLFAAGIKEVVAGFGLGNGGNMARHYVEGGAYGDGWLGSGSESGIGVIAYQLGFVGLLLFAMLLWLVISGPSGAKDGKSYKANVAIKALVLSLFINSFLQENCINSSVLCFITLSALLLSSLPERQSWWRSSVPPQRLTATDSVGLRGSGLSRIRPQG